MAKKRTQKNKSAVKEAKVSKNSVSLSSIKWGESYTSLFLGAIVVVVALVLVLSFLKGRNIMTQQTGSTSTVQNGQAANEKRIYTIKPGDDLWHISQSLYGSGYNWVDLADANNLSNPSIVYVGTKLVVPNVKPREATPTPTPVVNKITGSTYTIQKGDYLWDIAVRAYGDGYKWVEIAKANNLSNPDLVFSGNVLRLPR